MFEFFLLILYFIGFLSFWEKFGWYKKYWNRIENILLFCIFGFYICIKGKFLMMGVNLKEIVDFLYGRWFLIFMKKVSCKY